MFITHELEEKSLILVHFIQGIGILVEILTLSIASGDQACMRENASSYDEKNVINVLGWFSNKPTIL